MKAEVKPSTQKKALKQHLKPRTENVETTEKGLEVEIDDPGKLSSIPGIDTYTVDGEVFDGIGGEPVKKDKKALAKVESRKDAAKAFLTTLDGYTLYIVGSNRSWDVQSLKKYNSEIVELKDMETAEMFDFDKKVNFEEDEFDLNDEELLKIYVEFLPQ